MKINIFSENIFEEQEVDEKKALSVAKKCLKYYLANILDKSCLAGREFKTLSFDILYCDSEKTHQINREYRNKDYAADIITFAIFADAPESEKFVFDSEINLGEIIIALDKAGSEKELHFLISHGIMHLLGFDHQTEEDYNFIVEQQNKALGYGIKV